MKLKLLTILMLCAVSTAAFAGLRPYVGLDTHWRAVESNGTATRSVFGSKAPQAHYYGGIRFEESVGVELGRYEYKHHDIGHFKSKVVGTHFSLLKFLPVFAKEEFVLIGGIGLTMHKKETRFKGLVESTKNITIRNSVPRIMAGIEYRLNENVSLRGAGIWEHASSVRNVKDYTADKYITKDDYAATFGLQYAF